VPAGDETAQQLAKILGDFSFDAVRSEINHRFEELRRDFEEKNALPDNKQEEADKPAATATFQIEVPSSVVQMFKQPDYVSQYFVGEEGEKYWEDFIGSSRLLRLDNRTNMLDDEAPEERILERKAITFVELSEEEIQAEAKKDRIVVVEETAPVVTQVESRPEPVQPQVIQTVVQTVPASDETAQQLAKILGNFSFDAIRSEINHRFEELRRDLEEKSIAPTDQQEEPDKPATTATFQIETAKIPAPAQEQVPVSEKLDYSDLIIPDETDPGDTKGESSGDIDIMALLSAQAKRMENISTIEMMEMYGEAFSEVTLEELEKYINKNHK
jgi:hypothetical protein